MTASRSVEVRIPLRWADMDAYGHVNNIAVVQLLEEARVAACFLYTSPSPRDGLLSRMPYTA